MMLFDVGPISVAIDAESDFQLYSSGILNPHIVVMYL